MKKHLRFIRWFSIAGAGVVLAMTIFFVSQRSVPAMADANNEIYSSNMILVDLNDKKVVSESGSQEKIYPASLTKIMTALVSIERLEALEGIEVKCGKCGRVIRLKNYTDQTMIDHSLYGELRV